MYPIFDVGDLFVTRPYYNATFSFNDLFVRSSYAVDLLSRGLSPAIIPLNG